MRIWDTIKKWGAGLMQRASNATGIAREYKDIFEVGGVPAFRQYYDFGIFVWQMLYRGLYRPWHVVPAPTIKDANAKRELYRMNAPKAVCAELASLVWGEETEIRVSTNGWPENRNDDGIVTNPDPLNEFIQDVLRRNAFFEKTQEIIEQALALGGAAVKVWAAEPKIKRADDDAREVRLGYCTADQFVPLSWDNAQVYEGVFISRRAKNGWYYTRLEWHRRNGETYVITNELYRAEMQQGAGGNNQDILGVRCPLAELYPELDEMTEIRVEDSLFSYFRTPIANNLDTNSPLGMSIYGNALGTLHALDICYDSFVSEFELGQKRIIVPAQCVSMVIDPVTQQQRRYFDASNRVYTAFDTDAAEAMKITDNSVELRVEEHVAALNAYLSILCLQLGFSANTFSFDQHDGLKTATEVVSENSKTYKTVRTVQNQLRPAFEHMVQNIIDVAVLYDIEWRGQKVESLAAGGYEVKVNFDDGVTQDRQTNINEGVMLVNSGLLSKFTFLTDRKYGHGLTDKEAQDELDRIKAENDRSVDINEVRLFGGGA